MTRAAITAVGHYLPDERLTNADLEKLVDTTDEWIRTRTGISERRILRDKTKATAYMAIQAGREVLKKRGMEAADLDMIIVSTVTPDMFFPSTACLVQAGLGAGKSTWGFDLSAACSGFVFGLRTAASFIESGQARNVLLIGSDKMSSITDYTDRNTCVLFGDAAAAVLLEPDRDGNGLVDVVTRCDGEGWEALCMLGSGSLNPPTHETVDKKMHYIYQDGRTVFRFAVGAFADIAQEIMQRNGLTSHDVRYFVPHQANERIINAAARRMGLSEDQVMVNIGRYGNTTAATIPLCLCDWEHTLRTGDNLVLAAFGGGYTWGACYVRWAYDGATAVAAQQEQMEEALA